MSLLLGGPVLVETQAGTALNDVAGIAMLLTAVAVATRGPRRERTLGQDVVTGLALGLAIGMKLTFLVPAGLLAVGLVVTAGRGRRLRSLAVFGVTAATGLYWYVRNLIVTGNPVPVLDAGLGPLRLDAVTGSPDTRSVSHYLFDGDAWSGYLVPGFEDALGPLWFAFLLLVAVGLVGSVVAPAARPLRMVALVGIASLVAFIFTPQYLDLAPGSRSSSRPTCATRPGVRVRAVARRDRAAAVHDRRSPRARGRHAGRCRPDPASWPVLRYAPVVLHRPIDRGSRSPASPWCSVSRRLVAGRWCVALDSRAARRAEPSSSLARGGRCSVVAIVHPRYSDSRYQRTTSTAACCYAHGRRPCGTLGSARSAPRAGPVPAGRSDLSNHVRLPRGGDVRRRRPPAPRTARSSWVSSRRPGSTMW